MDHDGASDPDALPPPLDTPNSSEWTSEEEAIFECALADAATDASDPAFFENVAKKLPRKTVEDVKRHYEALVCDVEMIEAGNVAVPDYPPEMGNGEKRVMTKRGKQRRNGTAWTEEEHQLFLMGMNKFGKGDWRAISRYYVGKKTPTQVASHAEKFFRRRPTIHDVQTVNPPFDPPPPVINLVRHTVGPFDTAAVANVFRQKDGPPPPPPPPGLPKSPF